MKSEQRRNNEADDNSINMHNYFHLQVCYELHIAKLYKMGCKNLIHKYRKTISKV